MSLTISPLCQALIKMEDDGSFFLTNISKSSIFLNGKEIASGHRLCLSSSSLIEVNVFSSFVPKWRAQVFCIMQILWLFFFLVIVLLHLSTVSFIKSISIIVLSLSVKILMINGELQIRGMSFVFEMNHKSVSRYLANFRQNNKEKYAKFEWS